MNMRFHWFHTVRRGSFILLASLLVAISAASGSAQSKEDVREAVSEACTVHAIGQGSTTYAACEAAVTEASRWPDLDPSSLGEQARQVEQAKAEATEEAAGWPSLNPSGLAMQVLKIEQAREEAAGWPNFDPSSLGEQVRRVEAAGEEAARWPNYDPSRIAVAVAQLPVANGPHDDAY